MKVCAEFNCKNPVFSNHYCSHHQYLRTDEKYLEKKNKPRIIKKRPVASSKEKRKEVDLLSFYREILSERPHVSFITGKPLNDFDRRNFCCCAHVLAKGQNKYPRFKAYKKNIVLLTYMEHHLFDNGSEAQRNEYAIKNSCSWQPLYDLKEELLDEYKNLPSL